MLLRLCSLIQVKLQTMKTYTEAIQLKDYEDRFKYLSVRNAVGAKTFGKERYLNQVLYTSPEWRSFRHKIIARDNGCDLAHPDRPITGKKILIHHINPLTVDDIVNRSQNVFDQENVICVTFDTHQALHYGDERYLERTKIIERKPNDTSPWRKCL